MALAEMTASGLAWAVLRLASGRYAPRWIGAIDPDAMSEVVALFAEEREARRYANMRRRDDAPERRTAAQALESVTTGERWRSQRECAAALGVTIGAVAKHLAGDTRRCGGHVLRRTAAARRDHTKRVAHRNRPLK